MPFLGLSAAPFARVGDWQAPPLSRGAPRCHAHLPCLLRPMLLVLCPPSSGLCPAPHYQPAHLSQTLHTSHLTPRCLALALTPSQPSPAGGTMRGALSRGTGTAAGHSPSSCCCSDRALFIDFGKKASAHSGPHSRPLLSAGLWSCQCPYGLEQATCQSSNKDPEQPIQFQCLAGRGLCECEVQPLVNREGLCPKT